MTVEILTDLEAPELDVVSRKRTALVIRQLEKFRGNLISKLNQASRYVRPERFGEEVYSLCEKECRVLASRLRSAINNGELLKYTQELMVKAGISKIELRAIWDRAARS